MTEFHSPSDDPLYIPDNLTIPQFIIDGHHPRRPIRAHDVPWLIQDSTDRKIGYEEIRSRTFGLANALSSGYGIGENDTVLIFGPNHVDYPIVIWAVHRLGGVISGANPDFGADELLFQLITTKACLLVVHPSSIDTALSAAHAAGLPFERIVIFDDDIPKYSAQTSDRVTLNDLIKNGLQKAPSFVERHLEKGEGKVKLAFLCFSSGTTGKPKAVAISHYAVISNVIQLATHNRINEDYTSWDEQRFRPGDVAIGVLPIYHIYGLVMNLHFLLFSAMTIVIIPKYNFVEMLKSIVRHRITHLMLVPPQVVALCKHPAANKFDLRHVRFLVVGAAPTSAEINEQLFKKFPDAQIGQAYGMTETSTALSMFPVTQKRGTSGSAGQLIPGVVARVVKSDGSLARCGELGELHVQCPSIALGYSNDEKATRETFVDGWVRTGDEIFVDENSEVFVVDRLKEIMKVKGFQVAPAELEGCLLDHPDVLDTCVVGIADEFSGEVPMAFVVLSPEASKRIIDSPAVASEIKADIMKHVADNKVKYKWITGGIEFIDSIPKNASGKLLRRVLRDRARSLALRSKL